MSGGQVVSGGPRQATYQVSAGAGRLHWRGGALMKWLLLILCGVAAFLSVAIWEVLRIPVFVLMAFAFVMGFARPQRPWRWAIMAGAGYFLWSVIEIIMPNPQTDYFRVLLGTAFALVAAYGGVSLRAIAEEGHTRR